MDTLITRLNEAGVRYLLIGGQAIRLHGLPRFSMDWDLFVPPHDEKNFKAIGEALSDELDLEVLPMGPRGEHLVQTYQTSEGVLQFHLAVPGLCDFDEAESRAVTLKDENGAAARCVCLRDLLASKEAAHRPQDHQDILFLRARLAALQE